MKYNPCFGILPWPAHQTHSQSCLALISPFALNGSYRSSKLDAPSGERSGRLGCRAPPGTSPSCRKATSAPPTYSLDLTRRPWQSSPRFVDPGATAVDNIDGNITSKIAMFGAGAVNMNVETTPDTPYIISYSVSDEAGNAATVRSTICLLWSVG